MKKNKKLMSFKKFTIANLNVATIMGGTNAPNPNNGEDTDTDDCTGQSTGLHASSPEFTCEDDAATRDGVLCLRPDTNNQHTQQNM
ncbi:hypothetical protein [uncultured Kordia sp.]|uniref:hypothetical protein n=1 Tax=uncultured Kordia sp. TaxID=507699 RepID=UPI0026167D50|nr:hypothetical protein [uncultured Kordia sp.]